jgi:hypothetical protein
MLTRSNIEPSLSRRTLTRRLAASGRATRARAVWGGPPVAATLPAPVGKDRGVIRLVFLLRRKAGLSLAEFSDRWRVDHGPIVAGHQTALGVLRYTQTHRVEDPMNEAMARARGGMEPPYDGVAELWWASEDALGEASGTEAGRRAGAVLLADEAEFIDLSSSPLWLAHEYPQVNPVETIVARPNSRIVKLHFPLRHPAGMSLDDAQRYWRVQHGPLIRSMAPAMGMLRYQQVHRYETPFEAALRTSRGTEVEAYTGHAEAWFERGGAPAPEAADAGRRAIEDERVFIDFARSAMWIGKEHVFVDQI